MPHSSLPTLLSALRPYRDVLTHNTMNVDCSQVGQCSWQVVYRGLGRKAGRAPRKAVRGVSRLCWDSRSSGREKLVLALNNSHIVDGVNSCCTRCINCYHRDMGKKKLTGNNARCARWRKKHRMAYNAYMRAYMKAYRERLRA